MTLQAFKPSRLSYSQVNSYSQCSQRYLLEKLYGIRTSTWYATLAGKAIHEITEKAERHYDLGEDITIPDFGEAFSFYIKEAGEQGIEVKPSGRVLTNVGWGGGPNKKDFDWWMLYGPKILKAWWEWKQANQDWKIALLPGGVVGVEVAFEVEVGGEPVVGYIDRVYEWQGKIIVKDLKTGKTPESDLQLEDYFQGLYRAFGVTAHYGYYGYPSVPRGQDAVQWKLTEPFVFRKNRLPYLAQRYTNVRAGVENGVFLANVSNMCRGCVVRDYCPAVDGSKAHELPVVPILREKEVDLEPAVEEIAEEDV